MLRSAAATLLFAWLPCSASSPPLEITKTVFYVSPAGNDRWSGALPAADARRQDGPLATLAAARDAIRRLKQREAACRAPSTSCCSKARTISRNRLC